MTPVASVVIPAHNEAGLIGGLLATLTGVQAGDPELQIVVVCNGCSDRTAEIARGYPGVAVLELEASSKVAALNAGDAHSSVFPRIYLDADIEVDRATVLKLVEALDAGAPAAAPLPRIELTTSNWPIRAYYSIWSRLGYVRHHALGSGIYALSAGGRARFAEFPELIADDGYVYCLFEADERQNPSGATFGIRPPRTLRALTRRRIRIVAGNLELLQRTGRAPHPPGPGWRQVVREQPRLLAALPVFLTVNAIGAAGARSRARQGTQGSWGQDRTTRSLDGGDPDTQPAKARDPMARRGLPGPARRLTSVGYWKQLVRVLNFLGYDGAQRSRIECGPGVRMSPTVSVRNGDRVRIGANSHIGQGCCLWAGDHHGQVVIGDSALLAPNVFLTASNYDFDRGPGPVMNLPKAEADIRIGANTWLGANVVVVAGVTVGDGAIVAAGSVVTKDVEPYAVVAGVPARFLRYRHERPAAPGSEPVAKAEPAANPDA